MATFEPAAVVTTTLAVPAVPAGAVAVIVVLLTTVVFVAATPPIVTPVAPVKLVPVMVTLVPPAVGPLTGEMEVTLGNDEGMVMLKTTGYGTKKLVAV